jgi:U4/U6.U5 tri-snRNP component SNU23
MSDSKKVGAYGLPVGTDNFRNNKDTDEIIAKAKEKEAKDREEAKARYEAKLAGQKYYKQATGDETFVSARRAALDVTSQIGKVQLVDPSAGQGKRGRGAGFYCEACDLTFKDNKQLVDHLNTQQHLLAIGHTGKVQRATVDEVRKRILHHVERQKEIEAEKLMTVDDRVQATARVLEREREEKRKKRKLEQEKKKAVKEEAAQKKMDYGEDVRIDGEHDEDDMMTQMGFTGFGTSKK